MRRHFLQVIGPRIVLAISIALALIVVAATYPTVSSTYDEPEHLATGLQLLDLHTYYYEHHHPPLARVAIALGPYLAGSRSAKEYTAPPSDPTTDFWNRLMRGYDEGRRILYSGGHYDRVLTLARAGILPFLLIALLATYAWARSIVGEWPAVLAVVLLCTVPPFLGNAGIATLDIPVAALGIASLWVYCRWLDAPRLKEGLVLGLVTGAAIMTKFSAIPFLAVSFAAIFLWRAWLVRAGPAPVIERSHFTSAAVALVTMLVVFWACYAFQFTAMVDPTNRPYESIDNLFGAGSTASRFVSDFVEIPFVPTFIPEMWQGIEDVTYHNAIGHRSYLLGEVQSRGWWYYYFVALGVKTPLLFLALGVPGILLMLGASWRTANWRLASPALAFLAIFVFSCVYSNINLGVRHLLILYPMLAIAGAYSTLRLAAAIAAPAMKRAVVGAVVAIQFAVTALAFPDYMAYFNVAASSAPERFLIPIDLDWGQDLKRLESDLRKRGVERVAVSLYSSADLPKHDLPGYTPLEPHTPQTGWIAVSLWKLERETDYIWLRAFEPVARIGSSINLYHITDEAAIAKIAPTIIELAPGVFMRDKKKMHGSQQAFVEFASYVVVFDPSTVIQARGLLAEIRRRTSKPIRYAIVSHFHPDHSAGAAVFAAAGVQIVAAAAAKRDFEGWLARDFAGKLLSRPAEYSGLTYVPPSIYIDKEWVLDDGTQRLEVLPVGHGHTSGDLVGWMPKYHILFAGDLATDGYLNLANANIGSWIAILERLRAMKPEKVMRGHGPLAGPEALATSQQYLVDLQQRVREMVGRGLTYEDIATWYGKANVYADPTDISIAYTEAGGKRTRAEPIVTKRRLAWGVAVVTALVVTFGFVGWKRRRSGTRK